MTETELIDFLKTRMRVELDISEDFNPDGGSTPFTGTVKISLKGETDSDDVLLCESRSYFIVD